MILPLSFEFKCKTLEVIDGNLGKSRAAKIWSLYGSKSCDFRSYSQPSGSESIIRFKDPANLTDKLLTEIYFKTQLSRVGELELRSLTIALDWDNEKEVEKRRHSLSISGFGRHSMMDYSASEFNSSLYSNVPMNYLIEEILKAAISENKC